MKRLLLLATCAGALTMLAPEPADAQHRHGFRGHGRGGVVHRGVRPYAYHHHRRHYRRGHGWGPAVGLGVLGAAALGAAAVGSGYYAAPGLRQQQVYDVYGRIVWQTVRVC